MSVEKDDSLEAHRGQADGDVFHERAEGIHAQVHHTREAFVRIGERVVDGRRHGGAQRRCGAPGDFGRNQHVGQQRPMRAVLLDGTGGHDHHAVGLHERLDFRVRHLA